MIDHNGAVNRSYGYNGELIPMYPNPNGSCTNVGLDTKTRNNVNEVYDKSNQHCSSNIAYDTLPPNYPNIQHRIYGPSSLKHLYKGRWYYPPQTMEVPIGTMYNYDSGSYGVYGERMRYSVSLYPYRQRSPKEIETYSGDVIPLPSLFKWTQYPTITDSWSR